MWNLRKMRVDRGRLFSGRLATTATIAMLLILATAKCQAQPIGEPHRCIYPEQRCIATRTPDQLQHYQFDPNGPVRDVSSVFAANNSESEESELAPPAGSPPGELLSLNDAIQCALANAEVIRVLAGTFANSTGSTIYDPAITNTQIDQARAAFDPTLTARNSYNRTENPNAVINGLVPPGASIIGLDNHAYNVEGGIRKRKPGGGVLDFGVTANPNRTAIPGLALNPLTPSTIRLGYTKPLLQGRGQAVNLAPIVIARIDTERSYYQLKDSVQEMVRSIIDGYWGLVFARTDVWARQQQVAQLEFAFKALDARMKVGSADLGDTAQAAVSLASFRANLISAQADLLNREAAFLSALGLDPDCPLRIAPSTPPVIGRVEQNWEELLAVAEEWRPDLIESKLIVERDRQNLIIECNATLPQLDAFSSYQTNGLGGRAPSGDVIFSDPFQFSNIQVGLELELPVGRRAARAALRAQQLQLVRDQALLRQNYLEAKHAIALSLRNLDSLYAQYEAFKKVRSASRINLNRQLKVFEIGSIRTEQVTAIDVLVAVTDWGNAVSSEALALTQYNAELAQLQRQVGTILEDHGVYFYEDQFLSKGPGRRTCVSYPRSNPVGESDPRYSDGNEPAEESFELESLVPDLSKQPLGRPMLRAPGDRRMEQLRRPLEMSPLDDLQGDLPPPRQPTPDQRKPDQGQTEPRPVDDAEDVSKPRVPRNILDIFDRQKP